MKNYAKRDVEEYNNIFIKVAYWIATRIVYNFYFTFICRVQVNGRENIPKDNKFIVAPNHLSTLDPPLTGFILPQFISYMAKQELFEIPFLGWLLWLLGAFAVNREHLCPSTIKTAKAISKTNWVLGLFPEGTREKEGKITEINKGFVTLAKATKCGILPIGILPTNQDKKEFFVEKFIVNIGEVIPYNDNLDIMLKDWIKSMENLTGLKYMGEE